jgi:protoporphyrin/coproporphyrin ferrochelatase
MAVPSRIGVLLLNLGGPETLAEVEPFLVRLFSDREIIELPLGALAQPLFARVVAFVRGPAVRANYALIGGGSPQLRLTRAQGQALEERLNREAPGRFRVHLAMRYWGPSTEEALAAFHEEGISRIVTLTLYPHYSRATTGSSENELRRVLAREHFRDAGFSVSSVSSYSVDPLYLEALTDSVRRGLASFPEESRSRVVLLFSAHALPQKFVDRGDPYVHEIEKTRQGILARLGNGHRHVLGYQSRTGPVKWTGPGTDEVLDELGRAGTREVLVVPLSFVSDHIETLYEVDMLFAERARRAGITDYRRIEALNTSPVFIESLARLVETKAEETA